MRRRRREGGWLDDGEGFEEVTYLLRFNFEIEHI